MIMSPRAPRLRRTLNSALLLFALSGAACSIAAAEPLALDDLPATQLVIFKDGHALIARRGAAPTNDLGDIVIRDLPAPIMGAFWATVESPGVKLLAATAGGIDVTSRERASSFYDLLAANVGRTVTLQVITTASSGMPVTGAAPVSITGEVLAIPPATGGAPISSDASGGIFRDASARFTNPVLARSFPASLVMLKTADGIHAVSVSSITGLVLPADAATEAQRASRVPALTLDLDWANAAPRAAADVELAYIQEGVRWVPSYRVTLNDDSSATFELQATVINDIADFKDVPVSFVVGVPSFAYQDTLDPMALLNVMPVLSAYFGSATVSAMSNAIMSQSLAGARSAEPFGGAAAGDADLVAAQNQGENQFIFIAPSLTLAKGERAVVPLRKFQAHVEPSYTLQIPLALPSDVLVTGNNTSTEELERALTAPRVIQGIRFTNDTNAPITTAPATVIKDGRPLAQVLARYTPAGAEGRLDVNAAVDIETRITTNEVSREFKSLKTNGYDYGLNTLRTVVTMTNHKTEPVTIEVTRDIAGTVASADNGAIISALDIAELARGLGRRDRGGISIPHWYPGVNGLNRVEWTVTLQPGQSIDLTYQWSYYWR